MPEQCRDLNELNPKVKELALKLLEECKKQGLDIKISETYRSVARQDYLYAQGRSRGGAIVTNSKGSDMQSYHQWRLAFDIYNNVRGQEYNAKILEKVGAIGMKLGLEWGGSWRGFVDSPHFQYTFGLSIKDLKNGKKTPEYVTSEARTAVQDKVLKQEESQDYKEAVEFLTQKGIISSPELWLLEPSMKYTEDIIIKIGHYLFKTTGYEETINELVTAHVISSKELWLNRQYKIDYVKALMIKIAAYMKSKL